MVEWSMDLKTLVDNYHIPDGATDIIENAKIVLLVGISGAGKDSIKKALLRSSDFNEIVSHTTRAPRENTGVLEQDGVDYNFIDDEQAKHMLEQGGFIEAKFVHGTVYGTSVAEVLRASEAGIAVTDIDVQGVSEYKVVSGGVVAIFVVPPSYDVWLSRLKRRYSTADEFIGEWPKRRASAINELRQALSVPYYHFVINDELDRAVDVSAGIAKRPDTFTREDDEARLRARDLLEYIESTEIN